MQFKFLIALPLIAVLAACGGGGGDSADSAGAGAGFPPPIQGPGVAGTPLVTSVPSANYAAASEEMAAFNFLNAERQRCGFGQVSQSAALDLAARGHADWNLINGFTGHFQTSGSQGFTGASDVARIVSAGFASSASDFTATDLNMSIVGRTNLSGSGVRGMRALLNAPYHSTALLDGFKEAGIAARSTNSVTRIASAPSAVTLQVKLAKRVVDGPQLIASADVATYPCQGSTGILPALRGEDPNPVPDRDLQAEPLGSTITLLTRQGQQMQIQTATLVRVDTGAMVTLRPGRNSLNDPNPGVLASHQAYVTADAPLANNTMYRATITGFNGSGQGFTKEFTFTTGLDDGL